ncbi:protein MAIN-LIKE 1-like [Vigna angularis]|uniref:protein MAIN-LIKE 1-like n=1 Tax=Phaseolus angularis TaxID=3914 RepID=UPI000809D271|nr:protein MAIN-LIKE 1-like [Vigna angularis]
MARTHGGSFLHRGENFSKGERWRPTASARRRSGSVESDVHVEDHAFEEHDIEEFQFETNNFHLPVGEMTVTLYDVSSLLHLQVLGQLCHLEELYFEESRRAIMEILGVDDGRAGTELHAAHSAKVKLSWLRDIYAEHYE